MKKLLLVLGIMTCILGMTACGKATDTTVAPLKITQADAEAFAANLIEGMNAVVTEGGQAQFADDPVISSALVGWEAALEDIGDYQSIKETKLEVESDSVTIHSTIIGSLREADVEIILDKDFVTESIATNVIYSFGELMEKAALNTLLGMGTVFAVLILISLIISSFKLLTRSQTSSSKKKITTDAVDNTIAQIIEKEEEELADDCELVAVIAAAIAASQGAASTEGFVVRSIKRANTNKWQRA